MVNEDAAALGREKGNSEHPHTHAHTRQKPKQTKQKCRIFCLVGDYHDCANREGREWVVGWVGGWVGGGLGREGGKKGRGEKRKAVGCERHHYMKKRRKE